MGDPEFACDCPCHALTLTDTAQRCRLVEVGDWCDIGDHSRSPPWNRPVIPAALPAGAGALHNSYRSLATEGRYTSGDRECSAPRHLLSRSTSPLVPELCRGLTVAGSTTMSIRSCRGPADWGWIPAASTIRPRPTALQNCILGPMAGRCARAVGRAVRVTIGCRPGASSSCRFGA